MWRTAQPSRAVFLKGRTKKKAYLISKRPLKPTLRHSTLRHWWKTACPFPPRWTEKQSRWRFTAHDENASEPFRSRGCKGIKPGRVLSPPPAGQPHSDAAQRTFRAGDRTGPPQHRHGNTRFLNRRSGAVGGRIYRATIKSGQPGS